MIEFLREFWEFVRCRKRYWLVPILMVALLIGLIVVLAEGSALAPFIYTLF